MTNQPAAREERAGSPAEAAFTKSPLILRVNAFILIVLGIAFTGLLVLVVGFYRHGPSFAEAMPAVAIAVILVVFAVLARRSVFGRLRATQAATALYFLTSGMVLFAAVTFVGVTLVKQNDPGLTGLLVPLAIGVAVASYGFCCGVVSWRWCCRLEESLGREPGKSRLAISGRRVCVLLGAWLAVPLMAAGLYIALVSWRGPEAEVLDLLAELRDGSTSAYRARDIEDRLVEIGRPALPLVLAEVRKGKGHGGMGLTTEVLLGIPAAESIPDLVHVANHGELPKKIGALSTLVLLVHEDDLPPLVRERSGYDDEQMAELAKAWAAWYEEHKGRLVLVPWEGTHTVRVRRAAASAPKKTPGKTAPPPPPAPALSEKEKIERLLKYVAGSGVTFIRNGKEHSAAQAAEHLRGKWKHAGKRIKTARQFIDHLATRSSMSGKLYQVRTADGREVPTGQWLSDHLKKLEAPAGPKAPGEQK